MKSRFTTFQIYLASDPPPDLQLLAARYGGLGNVPSKELDLFEAARRSWNIRRLFRR